MVLRNARPRISASSRSGSTSARAWPGRVTPRKPSRSSSSSGETPCFFANPAAARSRSSSGGPLTHSSGVRSGRSRTRTASRRGPTQTSAGAAPSARRHSSGNWRSASRQAEAGSSSQPISSSSDGSFGLLLEVELGDVASEGTDAADVSGALGDGDRAAGVQQVERVRALEHLVVRGQGQVALEQLAALHLPVVEVPLEHADRRLLEVVDRPLALVLAVDLAPGHTRRPLEVEHRALALEEHREALGAVGDLRRDELDLDPAELLEVRPLRDLHPVAPDLPAEAPGAERRLLPVVLDQAHVVLREVDAERLER